MLSCSRILVSIFNLVVLLFSLFQIHVGKSMKKDKKQCLHENAGAMIFTATLFLVTSIIGIIGTCCKIKSLQAIFLWIMLVLTISSLVSVASISVLMPKESAERIWEKSKDGYWLDEYQPALQKALINGKDWSTIKTCYEVFGVCNVWRNETGTLNKGRNYAELGCCNPPPRCKLIQENETSWKPRVSEINSKDPDCDRWTNGGKVDECYDCDSCKAGYLSKYQENWQEGTSLLIARVVFLFGVSALAFHAFNDDHSEGVEHFT